LALSVALFGFLVVTTDLTESKSLLDFMVYNNLKGQQMTLGVFRQLAQCAGSSHQGHPLMQGEITFDFTNLTQCDNL
jgi:Adaptin N terminal region